MPYNSIYIHQLLIDYMNQRSFKVSSNGICLGVASMGIHAFLLDEEELQKEEIIFHIHQMGLQNHVVLVGAKSKDEVIGLYNKADIFFLPSVYEGIANVALEAMAMELPVVATKSGGMQEVITHDVDGMLADVYDSNMLAGLLLTLATDATKRAALGKQARERVLQQFTLDKQITIFETTYNNLLNNNTVVI